MGQPKIIVSSRDGAPVPLVAGADAFKRHAELHGWRTRITYSCADVPAGSRVKAHRLESVCVRFWNISQIPTGGYACWERRDGGPWRFGGAQLDYVVMGVRALRERLAA